MLPDHLCRRDLPPLEEAILASEYSFLEGLSESKVLSLIAESKLAAVQVNGIWYVEAPPFCEERLSSYRNLPQGTTDTRTVESIAEERNVMWRSLDFPLHDGSFPHTQKYLEALGKHVGKILFRSFSFPAHPVFEGYVDSNCLHESGFFAKFWCAPGPAAAIPYLPHPVQYDGMDDHIVSIESLFEWTTPFHLGGDLSSILLSGGAYSSPEGRGNEARQLGEEAAAELLEGDYDHTLVFRSRSPWSNFFCDVAWDYTEVVVSKPRRLIFVLLATDTD